ncbi:helicase-related protein [Nonomuraea mangrovi]|uniref:Helicase-related protein n=1 Tax=Nonomuraea mangrovi TaxID=2316207 RepID=A0ABW4T140_9ACTN
MLELTEHYRFRRELVERLQRDLLGPVGGPEEELNDLPCNAYISGVLFPLRPEDERVREVGENDVDLASSGLAADETPDSGVAMANVQLPSSMGLTFAVDPALSPTVTVNVEAAVYEPVDEVGNPVVAVRAERRTTDKETTFWRRRPLTLAPVQLDVTTPGQPTVPLVDGLQLRLRVRRPVQGAVAVTATLVNSHQIGRFDLRDAYCFFQPSLRVSCEGDVPGLVERPSVHGIDDQEVLVSRLLHRHAPAFATGHGCSADWEWQPPPPRGIQELIPATTDSVWTAFAPTHDVLLTDSNPDITMLRMWDLAMTSREQVVRDLRRLTAGYATWISDREVEVETLRDTEYGAVARDQIRRCRTANRRMADGISLLERDDQAFKAFQLANEAMAVQRARSSWVRGGRSGAIRPKEGRWRPFQIGFVLLCLDGITDPDHDDRDIADLLWFPTGGGKTEAYLGLTAYTVFLRRLRDGDAGGGVTALMRYTLRLLTLQQFERAAALICAMETMRGEDPGLLGEETISIGMWVGRAATPNTLKDAAESIRELRDHKVLQTLNPVQLTSCPWCGSAMDASNYEVDLKQGQMWIRCSDQDCAFHDGLPVHVVDEVIYRNRPTLLIATADKFAQIAWREHVAALFNRDGRDAARPPELIIQDELHLISGPLGTLAGLYETAIDIAADKPKVIASTATIRRSDDQGKALFDREVHQFPPAGIDARDSWFSVESPRETKASRFYVGLLTPSTSQATLLIRAYAALLHHAQTLRGDDAVRDTYWTLVGYFNSLRLLAAAELQVNDDVHAQLKVLAERMGIDPRPAELLTELTSRVSSSEIPTRLNDLKRALPDEAVLDTVLATNMISVGVDIDRLGLMAVMGQPQTTAEYIQATSRVGRMYPGLVVTLFNSARSRDRSHYENFASYHSALYRQVESTSVTPFSARARDRALHAVLVGLARLCRPEARSNGAAASVEFFVDHLVDLSEDILTRVKEIAFEEYDGTRNELEDIIERWRRLAASNPHLVYEAPRRKPYGPVRRADAALLRAFGLDEDLSMAYQTLWSLRDVDVESDLYLER